MATRTLLVRLVLLVGLMTAACRAAEPMPGEPDRPREPAEPAEAAEPDSVPPRLVEGIVSAADQARAADLLVQARRARSEGDLAIALERAEEVVDEYAATSSGVPALRLAAEVALERGDLDAAVEKAERYGALFPPDSDEARAAEELIAGAEEAREAEGDAAVRLGVILPMSGAPYLEQYGELVLQGVRLAEQAYRERGGARPLELVVRDNAGDAERSAVIVEEMERDGVLAVVGPLIDQSVRAAARARRDTSLVIVSPTASLRRLSEPNVYSLNMEDTRGAEALADFALRAGIESVATLYPRLPEFERQAEMFERMIRRGGGRVVATAAYDSGTTTFGEPLKRIAPQLPEALYIPAPERDVRQIAPQIGYYGIDSLGVQVLGGRGWASPEVRRLVSERHLEGVVASTPLFEGTGEVGWSEFVDEYERTHRRTLDNRFPALGYDAVRVILGGVPWGLLDRERVARGVGRAWEVRGATGVLSVESGEVARRSFLVNIVDDSLVAAPPPELYVQPLRPDSINVDSLFSQSSGRRR